MTLNVGKLKNSLPKPMKILRYLGILAGVIFLAGLGFFAWMRYDLHESMKTDSWSRDGAPSAEMLKRLADWNYPDSISRVVEVGHSSRANGDGMKLTIYCFAPADVPRMKAAHGSDVDWDSGFPTRDGWRWPIEQNAPRDLVIGPTARPGDYIHFPSSERQWTIIDVVRGISYQINIRS